MKYINLFDTQAEYDATKKYYPNVSYIEATDEVVYQEIDPDYYLKQYLTFEALETGTFTLVVPAAVDSTYMTSISYSTDNGTTWVDTTIGNTAQTIITPTIAQGEKVLWKGIGKQTCKYPYNTVFNNTIMFNVSGNIMSLLYGDNFIGQTSFASGSEQNFERLFYSNNKIKSAENLILPATTLAPSCYNSMFEHCIGLKYSPALPATTLAAGCYANMFNTCLALDNITMLATDISANNCLYSWVNGVAANGTFTKATSMTTLPSGDSGIPSGWTVVDA